MLRKSEQQVTSFDSVFTKTIQIFIFSSDFDFVSRLLNSSFASSDDVLAAFLNIASSLRTDPDQYLIDIGKEIASLVPGQMRRVNLILRNAST